MKLLQNSGVPIYKQIKISVITTMKAYEQLEEEGLVTAMQGKGFAIALIGENGAGKSTLLNNFSRSKTGL